MMAVLGLLSDGAATIRACDWKPQQLGYYISGVGWSTS